MAAGVGFAAGLLPDADILIRSVEDPLRVLDFHRGFSHSLTFIPLGGLIAALPLWLLLRRRPAFARVWLYATLGYALGGLLDACTSYGTALLWPWSDWRVAWSVMPILHPLFTLALGLGVGLALRRRSRRPAQVALAVALAWIGFGAVQHQRALASVEALATARGQAPDRIVVKPTVANLWLWRGVAEIEGMVVVDAVRLRLRGEARVYPGGATARIDVSGPHPWLDALPRDSRLRRDILRFDRFSDGWLVAHPDAAGDEFRIGDARFALLPDSLRPLWGISGSPMAPDRHVRWHNWRESSPADRRHLWAMLRGRKPATVAPVSGGALH